MKEEITIKRSRILVVDDDRAMLKLLRASLENEGFEVTTAADGVSALKAVKNNQPDLIVLDIMLPDIDGFEICRMVREWSTLPIIALSGQCGLEYKVRCLNLGADDYVTKPFSIEELVARIRTALRRRMLDSPPPTPPAFTCGDFEIDFAKRRVVLAGKEIKLTPTEYNLLQELALNAGKVLSYGYLLNKVWGPEYSAEKGYIHTYVKHLRSKIEPYPKNPRYIASVTGVGYRFENAP